MSARVVYLQFVRASHLRPRLLMASGWEIAPSLCHRCAMFGEKLALVANDRLISSPPGVIEMPRKRGDIAERGRNGQGGIREGRDFKIDFRGLPRGGFRRGALIPRPRIFQDGAAESGDLRQSLRTALASGARIPRLGFTRATIADDTIAFYWIKLFKLIAKRGDGALACAVKNFFASRSD